MRTNGRCWIALLFATILSGCATGPISFVSEDEACNAVEPGSCEWWSQRALDPPGVRNRCCKGKVWPVRPRPTGPRQQFSHTYHSATYWPLPYVCQDRQYIRDIVEIQRTNGWQQETTLYHRHFGDDQMLTVPGRLHLVDILEVTPVRYRTVYIQSSHNAEIDNVRMANVQQSLLDLTGGTDSMPVVIRSGRDYSRPASEVKIINDLYDGSVLTPRLGGAAGGASGGSAGGASSAAAVPTGP